MPRWTFLTLDALEWGKIGAKVVKQSKYSVQAARQDDAKWSDWASAVSPFGGYGGDAAAVIMRNKAKKEVQDLYKNMAPILARTLVILQLIEFCGLGLTQTSVRAKNVESNIKKDFPTIDKDLNRALPKKWAGEASDAYTKQVNTQRGLLEKMREHDRTLADTVTKSAREVSVTRGYINMGEDAISICIPIAMAILAGSPPPGNVVACNTFQWAVSIGVCGWVGAEINTMVQNSFENANTVRKLITSYNADVTEPANKHQELPKDAAAPILRAPGSTTVSSFDGPLAMSAAPDLATLVNTAQAGGDMPPRSQALVDALTGAGDGVPALTLPSLKQIGQAAGQLSQMSGQVSQMMNQFMGQIQQLASMAPKGKGPEPAKAAEKVAEKEAAPKEGATPAAGERAPAEPVAAGAGGAERAPVDVTTGGGEPAHRPSPVERSEPRP
jgi:hypothetical protein